LVLADFHLSDVRADDIPAVTYRSYDFRRAPEPAGELRTTLLAALEDAGIGPRPTGVEAGHLPHAVALWLTEVGRAPVALGPGATSAGRVATTPDLDAIRAACRLADVVQQTVKDLATAGVSEAELAGLAAAAMNREAGRRVPAILTVTAGAEATAIGGGVAT